MNISELNKLLQRLSAYAVPPFDANGLTSTRLKDGNLLNIYAAEESLMLFMQVEVLGEAGDAHPEIFRELLHSNIVGGRFGNLRIVYDNESTAIWICHDVLFETINGDSFITEVDNFVKNAPLLINVLREDIISAYLEVSDNSTATSKKTVERSSVNINNFLSV